MEEYPSNDMIIRIQGMLASGMSRPEAAANLVAAGVSPASAPRFVEEVIALQKSEQRRSGVEKVIGGILLLLVGGGITLGTYYLAGPGGTYLLVWGFILFGAGSMVVGLFQILVNAGGLLQGVGWLAVSVLVLGIVGGGSIWAYNRTIGLDHPPAHLVEHQPDQDTVLIEPLSGAATFSGRVTNRSDWTLDDVKLVVEFEGSGLPERSIPVRPKLLDPGDTGRYDGVIVLPPAYVRHGGGSYYIEVQWTWVPP